MHVLFIVSPAIFQITCEALIMLQKKKTFKGLRSPCYSLSLSKPIAFTLTTSKVVSSVFSFLVTHTNKFRYFSGVVKCEML